MASSLRLSAHPVELFAIEVASSVDVGGCGCDALVALFEVVGVVAAVGVGRLVVEFDNGAAHSVEEVSVVGDKEEGLGVALQVFLQPLNHLQVKVIGGLVEDEKVGVGDEHRGQGHALLLSAREKADGFVEVGNLELREDLRGPQLHLRPFFIGVKGVDVGLQVRPFFRNEQRRELRLQACTHRLSHRQSRIEVGRLLQHPDAQPLLKNNLPTVCPVFAGNQTEEGGLASTVARNEPHVLPFGHTERDVFEEHQVADALRQMLNI